MSPPDKIGLEPEEEFHLCPICDGKMELVYARYNQQVSVCIDCHSGITIPKSAWDIVRKKRQRPQYPKIGA